jgi:hypothetical protein
MSRLKFTIIFISIQKFILFTFQFLGKREERKTYWKITEQREVIGCCDFDNKNIQYWCLKVSFEEKSLMVVIFSSKHGEMGKSGLVLIIGIHFIFIFLSHFGFFRDVGWYLLVFMVFWRCFWMKMGWKKKFKERKIHYTLFFGYHIGDLILVKQATYCLHN